ncbi:hypothetical protein Ssi03_17360 [Sphaerisporangium siamense]|uniref:Uncharacterized protein n=1 Tax=Sphaerisporangium siamense TaxID=795645 RepID=A0A7W7DDT6_9ACTN|nr:hypothetical protein [Sphaerisporangium siamense]MBB4704942.1 hypothetical protein [Sphaerisporangium siamense]GII83746.1 hypothetical protein Ssi03_17360 [Sphaerisporangium siamense]
MRSDGAAPRMIFTGAGERSDASTATRLACGDVAAPYGSLTFTPT